MKKNIYLDSAATTRVYPKVVKAMNQIHTRDYGNPSSIHDLGEKVLKKINEARKNLALELGCKFNELIFTSGTTESNNLAILGLAFSKLGNIKKKIVVSKVEHSSIYAICNALKKRNFEIVEIGVDNKGKIDIGKLKKKVDRRTLLVSIIHVQNEIGVIQNIHEIGKICMKEKIIFHSDCAQSFGKIPLKVKSIGVDLVSAGAHKIGGPKGVGFLYVKEGILLEPIIYGGGQEKGLRGGTENVTGIVGFSEALKEYKKTDWNRVVNIRDYFISCLLKLNGKINGAIGKDRIFNNINVSFPNIDGELLVLYLSNRNIFCSSGSACENRKDTDKRILKAIGLPPKEILGSVRFSLDSRINKKDIDFVIQEIAKFMKK